MANTTGKKFGGRKKGQPNKVTKEIREAYQLLVESNIPMLEKWIAEIGEKDPAKAIDLLIKLSEYVVPKLSRTEVTDATSLDELMRLTPEERKKRIIELKKQM